MKVFSWRDWRIIPWRCLYCPQSALLLQYCIPWRCLYCPQSALLLQSCPSFAPSQSMFDFANTHLAETHNKIKTHEFNRCYKLLWMVAIYEKLWMVAIYEKLWLTPLSQLMLSLWVIRFFKIRYYITLLFFFRF